MYNIFVLSSKKMYLVCNVITVVLEIGYDILYK